MCNENLCIGCECNEDNEHRTKSRKLMCCTPRQLLIFTCLSMSSVNGFHELVYDDSVYQIYDFVKHKSKILKKENQELSG